MGRYTESDTHETTGTHKLLTVKDVFFIKYFPLNTFLILTCFLYVATKVTITTCLLQTESIKHDAAKRHVSVVVNLQVFVLTLKVYFCEHNTCSYSISCISCSPNIYDPVITSLFQHWNIWFSPSFCSHCGYFGALELALCFYCVFIALTQQHIWIVLNLIIWTVSVSPYCSSWWRLIDQRVLSLCCSLSRFVMTYIVKLLQNQHRLIVLMRLSRSGFIPRSLMSSNLSRQRTDTAFEIYTDSNFFAFQYSNVISKHLCLLQTMEDKELFAFAGEFFERTRLRNTLPVLQTPASGYFSSVFSAWALTQACQRGEKRSSQPWKTPSVARWRTTM